MGAEDEVGGSEGLLVPLSLRLPFVAVDRRDQLDPEPEVVDAVDEYVVLDSDRDREDSGRVADTSSSSPLLFAPVSSLKPPPSSDESVSLHEVLSVSPAFSASLLFSPTLNLPWNPTLSRHHLCLSSLKPLRSLSSSSRSCCSRLLPALSTSS